MGRHRPVAVFGDAHHRSAVGENFETSAVEFEVQYEIIEREGKGLGLAFNASYGIATRGGDADEIEFGPIVDYEVGKLALTLNPFLTAQVGENLS